MLKTISVMIDDDRLAFIRANITPGAREFSKWIRDAIDCRIAMEEAREQRAGKEVSASEDRRHGTKNRRRSVRR